MNALAQAGAALLGGRLARAVPLYGGDLASVALIVLEDGTEAVVKSGPAPRTEATMLEAISRTGAPAPRVLAVDDAVLVIERMDGGAGVADDWPGLGRALAMLHAGRPPRDVQQAGRQGLYGWPQDYAFSRVRIVNTPNDDWPTFWAGQRLLADTAALPRTVAHRLEDLAADLPNRLPRTPAPALLHGDLWGGNVLVSHTGFTAFIDPACYYGHCEVDIAMLTVFNSPDRRFFDTYDALEPGFEERRPIYSLWPALVHLRLFGSVYLGMVERYLGAARA